VALENFENLGINSAWESIRENIRTSAKENIGYRRIKHNKPWLDDECSKLIDRWKQAKLQWLQNPSQISGHTLQNLRHETSRRLRNKKGDITKTKLMSLKLIIKTKILEICTEEYMI
jgi:hypothetical protein